MADAWHYTPPDHNRKSPSGVPLSRMREPKAVNVGNYQRKAVTSLDPSNKAREWFDRGLLHLFGFHHEEAAKCFLRCLLFAPNCAFAHALVALCHSPNYNFNGETYYLSTYHPEEEELSKDENAKDEEGLLIMDTHCLFPSQTVAERHSQLAMVKGIRLKQSSKRRNSGRRKKNNDNSNLDSWTSTISEKERIIFAAIRTLTHNPGIEASVAEEVVGRPFAEAMKKVYARYPHDPEVAYFYADSLMVLNAWHLYEYPTGRPMSNDVDESRHVLETALRIHPDHAGLCHLYVHLCEMSSNPAKALPACKALRTEFPDSGHLIHMATHIDVLVGDYESCVRYNAHAVEADMKMMHACPDTSSTLAFYFGYIVHNFHMLVYGAILGGMEQIAMEFAKRLNAYLNEELFIDNPDLTVYLESYAALEIHVLVRFGRWKEILAVALPQNANVMLFRTATLRYARSLAYAALGDVQHAKEEADIFDELRADPSASERILHNNCIASLFAVDAPMARGEIAYREGKYDEAFALLQLSVELQDGLNYDEPWGKMQPVRHALGGLLLEQNHVREAEDIFRADLKFHPKNPWSLTGLIRCLELKTRNDSGGGDGDGVKSNGCCKQMKQTGDDDVKDELEQLRAQLVEQRKSEWADYDIAVPCACCTSPTRGVG